MYYFKWPCHPFFQLPVVSDGAFSGYLSPFNTTLDVMIQHLYEERFLLYARTVFKDNNYYVLGCCAAEMKKNVSYVVDVVVNHHGVVKECQCECAVGTGPDAHCKHVQCLLYGLVQFGSKNEILTRQTCTQRLQTFHKRGPRDQEGSLSVILIMMLDLNKRSKDLGALLDSCS